jgi:hypothetical protein
MKEALDDEHDGKVANKYGADLAVFRDELAALFARCGLGADWPGS